MKLRPHMYSFKNKFSEILILSILIVGFYSCDNNSDIITISTLEKTKILDVSYGQDQDQIYDIYLPEGRAQVTKTFILIHGGAWVSGDKNDLNSIVSVLQLNFPEYAIVNMNYRLASLIKNPFPMQTDDIAAVIAHLKTQNYQIGSELGFIGTSAGGHLSMLYSFKYGNSEDIKMVCSIVGPTNFTDTNYTNNPDYSNFRLALQLLTGFDLIENPEYYENLSPYHVATESAPATILFYGGKDELIPSSQGVEMNEKLNQLNVEHEFTLYENEGHGWTGINLLDTNNKLTLFIQKHF